MRMLWHSQPIGKYCHECPLDYSTTGLGASDDFACWIARCCNAAPSGSVIEKIEAADGIFHFSSDHSISAMWGHRRKHQNKRSLSEAPRIRRSAPAKFIAQVVSVEDLSSKDAIVAVMGPTGSGKSSFIELATGITGIVGHGLQSYTNDISVIRLSCPEWADSDICFIDTPGFNDTNKSDVDIFKMISDCLNNTYKRHIQLTGLLYFHRISDNRMAGTPLKNLRLFEQLCGENFNNIVLTTTMWGEVEEDEGTCRERELKDKFWKTMINRGSSIKRFLYTRESAFDVLVPIFEEINGTKALLLQKEMVDLHMKLKETSAGQTLYVELDELVNRQQAILGKLRKELKDPTLQPADLQALMDEYQKVSDQLQRATIDLKRMKISVGDSLWQFTRSIDWTRPFKFRNLRTKSSFN